MAVVQKPIERAEYDAARMRFALGIEEDTDQVILSHAVSRGLTEQ